MALYWRSLQVLRLLCIPKSSNLSVMMCVLYHYVATHILCSAMRWWWWWWLCWFRGWKHSIFIIFHTFFLMTVGLGVHCQAVNQIILRNKKSIEKTVRWNPLVCFTAQPLDAFKIIDGWKRCDFFVEIWDLITRSHLFGIQTRTAFNLTLLNGIHFGYIVSFCSSLLIYIKHVSLLIQNKNNFVFKTGPALTKHPRAEFFRHPFEKMDILLIVSIKTHQ